MARNYATCHPNEFQYGQGLCKKCWGVQIGYPRRKATGYFESALFRNRKRRYQRDSVERLKEAVMNVYTNGNQSCQWCGQCDLDVLTLDHMNNDGSAHRINIFGKRKTRSSGSTGVHMYRWIIKNDYPKDFQVLCFNCNWKKRILHERAQASTSLPNG